MEALKRLSADLGNPGAAALYTAARRKNLDITRKQVQDFVKSNSTKQVLGAPQRAEGKTISENDNRWMMDLVDVSRVPAGSWKFFLVVVNVFDRYLYARPLRSKDGPDVAAGLVEILLQARAEGRRSPGIISSDNGPEFRNPQVKAVLDRRAITPKYKDAGDLNALGLLDRSIGLLKRKLAEMRSDNKKSWGQNLTAAVASLNKTPKPEVLHGAAPVEVHEDPEVKFMLLQEQARALQHNNALNEKRTAQLNQTKTFRPQMELTKFKRNFQATYGDPKTAQSIRAGRVRTATGESFPLKQVRVVPATASSVAPAQENRKLQEGASILSSLERVLEGDEKMSLSKAAGELREDMRANGQDYDATLKKVGGRLIDLIKLAPDRFKLVERPHGRQQIWYFVQLA